MLSKSYDLFVNECGFVENQSVLCYFRCIVVARLSGF